MEEKDTVINRGKTVTVVISRRVFPGHEQDYDEWVRKLVAAATEAPGNTGATMLIPEPGKPGPHHVVLRFADQESVHAVGRLLHPPEAFARGGCFLREEPAGGHRAGDLVLSPECPELAPPPQWKMFLITTLAVYIASSIIVPIQGRLENWPFLLGNILSSMLVVGSLTWGLMPLFSRYVFRKWLYRD